ncbi:MAG: hypothetical protein K0U93_07790 [Gammaproteobacteria bacterium]|nr:hypothetical protein [Gammaproteobacteria bacterium]
MGNRWSSVGIEEPNRFNRLLFNSSTDLIIAHVSVLRDEHTFDSLYARHLSDKNYVRLADDSGDDISLGSPLSSENTPTLYALEFKARRQDDRYLGYDVPAIRKYNLQSMELALRLPVTELKPRSDYAEIWPSSIVGEKRTDVLYCTVGMQRKSGNVDYFLCEIALADGSVEKLTSLDHVFL